MIMLDFEEFGLKIPEILLPTKNIPMNEWAVIACDQYTQDREYWESVKNATNGNPSSLNLILPEVFLNDSDKQERISKIRSTMKEYLETKVFDEPKLGFLYLERSTAYGRTRKGLIVAVDLESYDWNPGSSPLIRATEATIPERIPPRMEIRRGAPLELPHIMLLVNDKKGLLVEAASKAKNLTKVYDGELMLGSGYVTGSIIQGEDLKPLYDGLVELKKENIAPDGSVFLFAVGDGNHSLATAKAVWNEYKESQIKAGLSAESINASPLRYALVEIVNIYDSGLTFEPIHRVLFNVDPERLVEYCKEQLGGTLELCDSKERLENIVSNSTTDFGFVYKTISGDIRYCCLRTSIKELAVSRLQPVLDVFTKATDMNAAYVNYANSEIDYIHGAEEVFRLGERDNTVAILLPPVEKDNFFATIATSGALPRKSFSMGEASEKRFYLEARKLF